MHCLAFVLDGDKAAAGRSIRRVDRHLMLGRRRISQACRSQACTSSKCLLTIVAAGRIEQNPVDISANENGAKPDRDVARDELRITLQGIAEPTTAACKAEDKLRQA